MSHTTYRKRSLSALIFVSPIPSDPARPLRSLARKRKWGDRHCEISRDETPTTSLHGDAPSDPDALDIDVAKLGRQRPAILPSAVSEVAFCFSIIASMIMAEYFISGAHIILPTLATELNIPSTSHTWVSSVLTLSAGASLLPLGRMADMYGGYLVFNAGMLWFSVWSLVAGFAPNYISFIFFRAMQGLGASAFLPTGIMLLGKVYRPGPRKNFVFSVYGAVAPLGFFLGLLIARMDWWGTATICPGLILVVFAITQSSGAPKGWSTPYIIVTMVLGVLFLAAGAYVERNLSADPFCRARSSSPSASLHDRHLVHPWAISGAIFAATSGLLLHLVSNRVLLVASAACSVGACLFFALMPSRDSPSFSYWAHVFPAMVLETAFIDILYTLSNVFITTRLPLRHQGLAGALINCTLYIGMCFFLGVTEIAVAATSATRGLKGSYEVAFWIGVGVAGVTLVVFAFMDIGEAKSDLTEDEKRARVELERGGEERGRRRVLERACEHQHPGDQGDG
ncbi:unnamed protein product [Parascedosporium putredinis]|uniref:Major facilitator superfamily (MFS) profile domain-containing protein n=1 Tax=Parascedosporium putredinis TaxID=1442378 RepID=A0A9P1H508_9PEZI|nr:unnamed protein product [Parascedosporium putredinis]CAI7997450.1 unnamed protein product [Parascedosporium putredinis]